MEPSAQVLDCVVVGAGFGGLGAALALAESGAKVAVCERLGYAGGCAGTFARRGVRHEAGATLSLDIPRDKALFIDRLATMLPDWRPYSLETASPRTFERFTARPGGLVGGIPRRAGLHHYRRLGPQEDGPGLWLVGDSGFPGQSTLATATGGVCTARAVQARLR